MVKASLEHCEVRIYSPNLKGDWDEFVGFAKNSNFLFFRDYMDYHSGRFVDHSLMFYLDGRLVSCLPATRIGQRLYSHQGLTYGGLVMHPDVRLNAVCSIMARLVAHIGERGFDGLVYNPMPYIYHHLPADEDIVALNGLGGKVIASKATCAARSGDHLKSFSENRRSDVRRFRQSAMEVARSYDFQGFMTTCASLLSRRFSAKPVHTISEIQTLANSFPNHIKLYAVHSQSQINAGVIIYCNACCSKVQYVGYDDLGKEAGAVAAIFANLMDEVLSPNSWLEFGHSEDSDGRFNEGVHLYKESLGARVIQLRSYFLEPDSLRPIGE
jgi:hypothetical protein